jgi:ribosomal protein L32
VTPLRCLFPPLQPVAADDSAFQVAMIHGATAAHPATDANGSGIRQRKVTRAVQRLRLSRDAAKAKVAELPSQFERDADDSSNDSDALTLSAPAVPSITRKRLRRAHVIEPPPLDLEASSVRVCLVYGMAFLTLTASFGCISTG